MKTEKSGRITRQDIDTGGASRVQLKKSKMETARDAANYLTEMIERNLTGWSIASGLRHGTKHGLKGDGLWRYASDAGAKTQSMYNRADLPGVLRNEIVKTAAPFQTFSFELFNTMKEVAGKTGMSMGTYRNRMGFVLRLAAAATAVNIIGGATTGRQPWELKSFIPFSNFWLEPMVSLATGKKYYGTARGLPGVASEVYTVVDGMADYMRDGNVRKLRGFLLRYGTAGVGIPGGVQIARTVDGVIAVAEGGVYDNLGALKYPVTGASEQIRSILTGRASTEAGKKYFASKDKSIVDSFFKDKPAKDRFRRQKTRARNAIKNKKYNEAKKIIDEWNKTFTGTTLQMPLFEQMYLEVLNQELKKEAKGATEQ